jgi:hypothetical protein
MEYKIYNPEDELRHWGVPGMKWGIRRYQNKDGTLTPAGRKRYNAELAKVRKEEAAVKNRQAVKARMDRLDARKKAVAAKNRELDEAEGIKSKFKKSKTDVDKPTKKSVKDMTDAELKEAIARGQLEAQYRQYNPEPAPKQSFGKQFMDGAVKPGLVNAGKNAIESVIKKTVDSVLKDKEDPNSLEALKRTYDKLDTKQKIDKILNPDKYLSEEDKTKRQNREFEAEDRAAKKEGYKDAADKAAQEKAAKAAKAAEEKAAANEAARKANEERSRQEYEKTAPGTYAYRNPKTSTSDIVNTGKTTTSGLLSSSGNKSILALPAPTVTKGERAAVDVLDTNGSVIASFDKNGKRVD